MSTFFAKLISKVRFSRMNHNSLPSATDMMTEGVVLTETFKDDVEYIGDNSIDSMQHLMSGGICMETLSETIATR